jgi:hypothetical protein
MQNPHWVEKLKIYLLTGMISPKFRERNEEIVMPD